MEQLIEWLIKNGFVEDGVTSITAHGVKTYDDTKPRVALIGGRARFKKDWLYITVGKRTVCVYTKQNGEVLEMENFNTKDFSAITEHITNRIK